MKRSLLTAVAVLAALVVIPTYVLTVKNIQINSAQDCLDKKFLESQYLGKNILFLNTSKIEGELKQKNSCLEEVTVSRSFPSTIQISAKSKVPVAKIDGTDLLATSDGLVIKKQLTTNIPTIYLQNPKEAKENTKLTDKPALIALEIAANLLKSDFTPSSIRLLDSSDIAVYSTGGIIALFTTQKAAAGQVDSLQSIMTKAKIDATKIEKIDLRFDKPVIVFK